MDRTNRGLILALLLLVVAVLAFPMFMGGMMEPGMMGQGSMPGGGWGWGLGMGIGALAMLAFWGALIVGVALFARGLGEGGRGRWHLSPTDILKRRSYGQIIRMCSRRAGSGSPAEPGSASRGRG